MLRALICNKTLKKVCCPNLDASEDVFENESRSSIGENESEKEVFDTSSTTEAFEDSESRSEVKDQITIAETDRNVEYLKNLSSRYVN